VLALLVILFVVLFYYAYKHFKNIEIERQHLINKFIQQQEIITEGCFGTARQLGQI